MPIRRVSPLAKWGPQHGSSMAGTNCRCRRLYPEAPADSVPHARGLAMDKTTAALPRRGAGRGARRSSPIPVYAQKAKSPDKRLGACSSIASLAHTVAVEIFALGSHVASTVDFDGGPPISPGHHLGDASQRHGFYSSAIRGISDHLRLHG